jgi:hypothetical protein
VRSAKVEIDTGSIREYRMECTGGARSTVRTVTRTAVGAAAVVAAVAALLTGGVITDGRGHAGGPEPAVVDGSTAVLALPKSIGVSNRAW